MEFKDLDTWHENEMQNERRNYDTNVEKIDNTIKNFREKIFCYEFRNFDIIRLRSINRGLQQAIEAYEMVMNEKQSEFIALPYLGENILLKLAKAVQDLKALKTIAETKIKDKESEQPTSKFYEDYETESLKEIMPNAYAERYKEAEIKLLANEYLNINCEWQKEQQELTGLNHYLEAQGYYKKSLGKKSLTIIKARRFFEQRYKIKIINQSKPSRFTEEKLKTLMDTFKFIVP